MGAIFLFAAVVIGMIIVVAMFQRVRVSNLERNEQHNTLETMVAKVQVAKAASSARDRGTIVLRASDIPELTYREGETLTAEKFVAAMCDERATDLMRETFHKAAEGAPVSWRLRAENVAEQSGKLVGRFEIPWKIQFNDYTKGSGTILNCEFTEKSRDALLKVRRGDWVTVEGTLSFESGRPEIKNATLAD